MGLGEGDPLLGYVVGQYHDVRLRVVALSDPIAQGGRRLDAGRKGGGPRGRTGRDTELQAIAANAWWPTAVLVSSPRTVSGQGRRAGIGELAEPGGHRRPPRIRC